MLGTTFIHGIANKGSRFVQVHELSREASATSPMRQLRALQHVSPHSHLGRHHLTEQVMLRAMMTLSRYVDSGAATTCLRAYGRLSPLLRSRTLCVNAAFNDDQCLELES